MNISKQNPHRVVHNKRRGRHGCTAQMVKHSSVHFTNEDCENIILSTTCSQLDKTLMRRK